MNKLPVGETIRLAYAFAFGEIGTVIGLIWIPIVVHTVANFFAARIYYPALANAFDAGGLPSGPLAMLPLAQLVLGLVVFSMIGVALTQQALGLRSGPAFAHVSFGLAEIKVFAGLLALVVLLFVFLFGGLFAANSVVAGTIVGGAPPAMVLGVLTTILAGAGLVFFAAVRLSFLLIPAVLDGGGLGRSWQLTRGNFWRIFAIGAATLLPLLIVMDIVTSLIIGPQTFTQDAAPAASAAEYLHRMARDIRTLLSVMPVATGVSLVLSPLMYGLLFTPAAFAYRFLSGKTVFEAKE